MNTDKLASLAIENGELKMENCGFARKQSREQGLICPLITRIEPRILPRMNTDKRNGKWRMENCGFARKQSKEQGLICPLITRIEPRILPRMKMDL